MRIDKEKLKELICKKGHFDIKWTSLFDFFRNEDKDSSIIQYVVEIRAKDKNGNREASYIVTFHFFKNTNDYQIDTIYQWEDR